MSDRVELEHDLLAEKWERLINVVVDNVFITILYGLTFLVALLLYKVFDYDNLFLWIIDINEFERFGLISVLSFSYYTFFETVTNGSTIGKYVTGTKVMALSGPLTLKDVATRSLIRLIPFEGLSFIGNYNTGWHDSISGTVVISVSKYQLAVRKQKFEAQITMANAG